MSEHELGGGVVALTWILFLLNLFAFVLLLSLRIAHDSKHLFVWQPQLYDDCYDSLLVPVTVSKVVD